MKRVGLIVPLLVGASAFGQVPQAAVPVPASAVKLNDAFWAPRLETFRTVTIPALLDRLNLDAAPMSNFVNAAKALQGQAVSDAAAPATLYQDAYAYQVIEAASYSLASHPDAA